MRSLFIFAFATVILMTGQPLFCQTNPHLVTGLEIAPENFDFLLAPNGDLYVIKKRNTTKNKTEVHVFTAASNYAQRGLEVVTDLEEAPDNFDFLLLAPNGDLYAIKKRNTTKNKTEVHVLTAASNYAQRGLEVVTDLEEAPDNFDFLLAPNRDLYAIKKRNTTKNKTEVHVLTAASNYAQRGLEVVTALEEAPDRFRYMMGAERDIYAVKIKSTDSGKTEVHILSAANKYASFGITTPVVPHPICASGPPGGCGILNVTQTSQCCSVGQHPAFSCEYCGPFCQRPTSSCEKNVPPPPPPLSFPPAGHWTVVTFTGANSPFPEHGYIRVTASSGAEMQIQDIGANRWKLVQDTSFLCNALNLICPVSGDMIALPWGTRLDVDAPITAREVTK